MYNQEGGLIMDFTFKIAGDQSILLSFPSEINDETSKLVRKLAEHIELKKLEGIEEVILGYSSLLIHYNPIKIAYKSVQLKLEEMIHAIDLTEKEQTNLIEIPVLYGGEQGPDITDVARINHLTEEEVIEIHTAPIYMVNFLGFTPGFPFLSGLSNKIHTSRLRDPRTKIKAGSVGIGNNQTGIYPVSSPGGWRLIGHTPITLYNPKRERPFLLSPGDMVKFKAITKEEYERLGGDSNI